MRLLAIALLLPACSGPQGPAGPPGTVPDAGAVPASSPSGLTFVDEDPRQGLVTGALTIQHAADESDVTAYAVYWGTDAGVKVDLLPIVEVAKTGQDITYRIPRDMPVPAGATSLLAFAVNADGENATAAVTTAADNYAVFTDLQPGLPGGTYGAFGQVRYDSTNSKVLFTATRVTPLGLVLFRCAQDGTQCTTSDVSGSLRAIDPVRAKLLFTTPTQGQVVFCDLDATGCATPVDVFTGSGLPAAGNSIAAQNQFAIDAANHKLLIPVRNNGQGLFGLIRAELDGTSPSFVPLVTTTNKLFAPGLTFVDSVNAKLIEIVTMQDSTTSVSSTLLFRCDLDGTNCTQPWTTALPGAPFNDTIAAELDPTTHVLVAATYTLDLVGNITATRLVICDTSFTSCTTVDPADGQPWGAGGALAIDSTHGKLILDTHDFAVGVDAIKRCELAGFPCTDMALPGSRPLLPSGDQQLLGVFLDATTGKLASYTIRTW
jgi:hypothetical protein